SLKYTKQALRKGEYTGEDLEWVKEIVLKLMDTEDHKEAFAAIMEKRKPVFKGR
ncbi:MAG: enoyl-CoA hydratase, partial [Chloroflexi bacterium]|nr:enoyl-CoA hydratase [Chloroflexota bacterium]